MLTARLASGLSQGAGYRVADAKAWLEQHAISDVECLVPDINGILRGKTHARRQDAGVAGRQPGCSCR